MILSVVVGCDHAAGPPVANAAVNGVVGLWLLKVIKLDTARELIFDFS